MKGTPLNPPERRGLGRQLANAPGATLLIAGYVLGLIRRRDPGR